MRSYVVLLGLIAPLFTSAQATHRSLSQTEVHAVIQAVEDEIYDYGYHAEFYQIGENVGTAPHWKARIRIYVNPRYNEKENIGEVIYRFMPYGEIFRVFSLGKNGQVELDGQPPNRFPITQPSHQTVFMDDEDVCRLKKAWVKRFYVVDTKPSEELLNEASRRQKLRVGYSERESKRHISGP